MWKGVFLTHPRSTDFYILGTGAIDVDSDPVKDRILAGSIMNHCTVLHSAKIGAVFL